MQQKKIHKDQNNKKMYKIANKNPKLEKFPKS